MKAMSLIINFQKNGIWYKLKMFKWLIISILLWGLSGIFSLYPVFNERIQHIDGNLLALLWMFMAIKLMLNAAVNYDHQSRRFKKEMDQIDERAKSHYFIFFMSFVSALFGMYGRDNMVGGLWVSGGLLVYLLRPIWGLFFLRLKKNWIKVMSIRHQIIGHGICLSVLMQIISLMTLVSQGSMGFIWVNSLGIILSITVGFMAILDVKVEIIYQQIQPYIRVIKVALIGLISFVCVHYLNVGHVSSFFLFIVPMIISWRYERPLFFYQEDRMMDSVDQNKALNDVYKQIASSQNIKEIAVQILAVLPPIFKSGFACFYSIDNCDYLRYRGSIGFEKPLDFQIEKKYPLIGVLQKQESQSFILERDHLETLGLSEILGIKQHDWEQGICLILKDKAMIIGFVFLGININNRAYSKDEIAMCHALAVMLSQLISKTRHLNDLNTQAKETTRLVQYKAQLGALLTIEDLLTRCSQILIKELNYDFVFLILEKEKDSFFFQIIHDKGKIRPVLLPNFPITQLSCFLKKNNIQLGFKPEEVAQKEMDHFNRMMRLKYGVKESHIIPVHIREDMHYYMIGIVQGKQKIIHKKTDMLQQLISYVSNTIKTVSSCERVKHLQDRYDAILKNMAVGIILCDHSLNVSFFNDKSQYLTERTSWQVLGKHVSALYDLHYGFQLFEKITRKQKTVFIDMDMYIRAEKKSCSLMVGRIILQGKEYLIGVLSDNSDLKNLQRRIEQVNRLSTLQSIASGIAFEIRNPLVPIRLMIQLLPKLGNDPDFRIRCVEIINEQVDRINSLCQSLLHLGRPSEIERQQVDLNTVFEEINTLLVGEVKSHLGEIEFENRVPEKIYFDKNQIIQVFLNIILNAVQSLPKNLGEVNIRFFMEKDDFIVVEIQDNGFGIQPEHEKYIFEPFFTTSPDRVGLGLTIVKRILNENQSKIEVNSAETGTSILLHFPVARVIMDFNIIKERAAQRCY